VRLEVDPWKEFAMNEKEKAAAQSEALESTAQGTVDRSRIWTGLNLFLAASARREKNAAARDAESRDAKDEQDS
jgi:hypothetical protein